MSLVTSISGIRGTIGGAPGENFTPFDIVSFTTALGTWYSQTGNRIVVGRDARLSGKMVEDLVTGTLQALGLEVIQVGLTTTPTVQMIIPEVQAAGGIMISASHNPMEWNALKPLNNLGEFLGPQEVESVLKLHKANSFHFASIQEIGKKQEKNDAITFHIQKILELPIVDTQAIKEANFAVALDAVNSGGGVFVPQLLQALGVTQLHTINCEPTGVFSHNPEPLEHNLSEIKAFVKETHSDLGIVVDPDVDRLVFIDELGEMVNEEYTVVMAAEYVMEHQKGMVVSNLSSSRALADVAARHGCTYVASPVGEINVVNVMKETSAIVGGEGSGGVIYPELHYGRDALVGIALILSHLARKKQTMSELRKTYPDYVIVKTKIDLRPELDVSLLVSKIKETFNDEKISDIDGIKIDFKEGWVQLRKSNTEPIIRIYAEAQTQEAAEMLINQVKEAAGV